MSKSPLSPFLGFLALLILSGMVINFPFHNFQNFLSQGDHGRDLYAAQAVLRGELPYKDFWWVYGPLMPYYYALFFKTLGVSIPSILVGKIILNILAGIFFFLGLRLIIPTSAAFLGGLWLMTFHQDFFFTYNHAGGIALIMAAVWMQLGFIKTAHLRFAWGSLLAIFVLGLIKINFAITALGMSILVFGVNQFLNQKPLATREKCWLLAATLGLPLIWLGVYSFLLHGLSVAEIRQCLPYLGGDEPYNRVGPLETIPMLLHNIWASITAGPIDMALCLLVLVCSGQTLYMFLAQKLDKDRSILIAFLLGYGTLFYAVNLHEFIKSGVFYRAFWAQPFSMFLSVLIITTGVHYLSRPLKQLLGAMLLGVVILANISTWQMVNASKNPTHFFGGPRGGIYINNDRTWIQTVILTTKQLKANFNADELFLSLPYDCLYYYLTDKKAPTRQLIFFDHIHILPEQEQKIIAELEAKHIHGILVSSRQSAKEQGLGTLGVSYCPLLTQYIMAHFTPFAKIGDWDHEPGWAWNHGTLLYKRK